MLRKVSKVHSSFGEDANPSHKASYVRILGRLPAQMAERQQVSQRENARHPFPSPLLACSTVVGQDREQPLGFVSYELSDQRAKN